MNENSTISNAYDGKHDEYGHDLPRWMNFEHVIDIGALLARFLPGGTR